VNQEIKASPDGKAELTLGKKKFSEGVGIDEGDNCTCQTAPSSPNANRPKFVKILLVFVKCQEPAEREQLGYPWGDFIVK
jgi:hypothetical protein